LLLFLGGGGVYDMISDCLLSTQVLQGVRVVKYYNWEASFEKRLAEAREEEVALIKRLATVNAFNSALMTTVPMLMLIAMVIRRFS
jgi:hypothetical protein